MENEKPKKNFRLRYFLAIIGVLRLIWVVVTGFHDILISIDGSLCVEKYLGSGFYEHWKQNRRWRKKNRWNDAAISYIKTYDDPDKEKHALELLKQHCSKYIFITKIITPSMNNKPNIVRDGIFVKNWSISYVNRGDPVIYKERTNSMLFWATFVLLCIVDIRKLKRIFIWSK